MNDLYVVSTYYHALISCVRELSTGHPADIMVTDYIPQYEELTKRLADSGMFGRAFSVGAITEYQPKSRLDHILNGHRSNVKAIASQLGTDLKAYENIYIFHDDTWFARYLKCAKIPYHLIEDALDCFKSIKASPFSFMCHKADIKAWVKNMLRIGYTFCGYDKYTRSVEVNSADGVQIRHLAKNKLVERPRRPMFDALTAAETEVLRGIFMRDIPAFDGGDSMLLLTQPLYADGCVGHMAAQAELYTALCEKYRGMLKLIVKPHPRDELDYAALFPHAMILDKNMPIEIVAMIEQPHFAKVVSFGSTCTKAVSADEYVSQSIDELD